MSWDAREHDADWPYELLATDFTLKPATTALLVIDMHHLHSCSAASRTKVGRHSPQIAKYWHDRIENTTVPNIQRLIEFFRASNGKIVYTRNVQVTAMADELTPRLRRRVQLGRIPDYEIDRRLAPTDADLILDKLTSSCFTASFLDHALRNMHMQGLVMTGIMTDMCVLGTARAAAELGYDSLICEDACATLTRRAHTEALLMHARVFGRVATTDDVIEELAKHRSGNPAAGGKM